MKSSGNPWGFPLVFGMGTVMEKKPIHLVFLYVLILIFFATSMNSFGCSERPYIHMENTTPKKTIEQVLEEHTDEWMSLPGVVGTGIGESEGKLCIKVFVIEITPELQQQIPSEVEGYPVIIEETGEFKPF